MAFSAIHPWIKTPCKKHSAIKRYGSADKRLWSNNILHKSIALHDDLTCMNSSTDSSEISKLVEEIKLKDDELDRIHSLYKTMSMKYKDFEEANKDGRTFKSDDVIVKKHTENFEEILKERDELKKELSKMEDVNGLMQKLKMRASEADKMEQEIAKLKKDLQQCGSGGSGDKMATRVNSDSQCNSKCNQCNEYVAELTKSKSMLELKERKLVELNAERNFLCQRSEMIRFMEAELLLYKTKFEECECKMLSLKEIVVKAEINEKKLKESQCKLKTVVCQLQESEQQNEKLIEKIERLDMDLKERDLFIDGLNQRLRSDKSSCNQSRRAIACNEVTPGKVQSIVKQMSKEPSKISTCKCNIENCHCAVASKVPCIMSNECNANESSENVILNESYISINSFQNGMKSITPSEADRLKVELSSDEVRLLRKQNAEFDKEIHRLKEQLGCASKVLEDIEKERFSNCELEGEINVLKVKHSQELEKVNSNFRASICEKLSEIQSIERKLAAEIEEKYELENKLSESLEKLDEMQKYCECYKELSTSYESLEACHKKRLREMDDLKCECAKSQDKNSALRVEIDKLNCELAQLKAINKKDLCDEKSSKEQRSMIKSSVLELKKFHDEKTYMIKCYEKKISILEAENESLKCLRDNYALHQDHADKNPTPFMSENILFRKLATFGIDSLTYEELTELHDRFRCAMMKLTNKDSHTDIEVNYSKMIEELCQKYNITSSKELILDNLPVRDYREIETCSAKTFPKSRQTKKIAFYKKRPKSSEMIKKSLRK